MSTAIQAILLGVLVMLSNAEWFLGTCFIQRPLILGPLTGLIMGDMEAGIIMGATMELAFAGATSIGGYDPPDMISGTILGVAFAINSGQGPEMALTLGIPIATIMLAISNSIGYPILQIFAHICDRNIEEGKDKAFQRNFILSGFVAWGVTTPLLLPLAFYFGTDKVTSIMGSIPEFVSTGMDIAGGLLPAMGFAMLAQMIMKKDVVPFFFIGYFVVAYSGISTTGVALLAVLILAVMFTMNKGRALSSEPVVKVETKGDGLDEF
ncbi:MAG: PTS sugar transporter subunit IIC [Lachnospiraceae bacterium]|nr:PTS sugar transporter subunit IIC [Lachnospiraceae bacterium]